MAAVIPPISQTGMMRCGGVRWLGSIRQWPSHVCRGPSMTHLIWVGAILVRHDFCLPMTHQVHLGRRRGSGRPPSISTHGPLPPEGPLQGSSLGSESWPGATQSRLSLEAARQEPRAHLEVIQELCCDRVRGPNHHFGHILGGKGAQLVRWASPGCGVGAERQHGEAPDSCTPGRVLRRSSSSLGRRRHWACHLPACTHPAGQHAQGPLMQVHDGVVLPLVVVDLLEPEQGWVSW